MFEQDPNPDRDEHQTADELRGATEIELQPGARSARRLVLMTIRHRTYTIELSAPIAGAIHVMQSAGTALSA